MARDFPHKGLHYRKKYCKILKINRFFLTEQGYTHKYGIYISLERILSRDSKEDADILTKPASYSFKKSEA